MANDSENKRPVESNSAPSDSQTKTSGEQKPPQKDNGAETSIQQGQPDPAPPFSLESVYWPHPIEFPVSMEVVRDPYALERR
ncbi:hypothetical protein NW768_004041 [Fusarium equiseti]|uniref:Uncharacterized protein n=1 Tax=Fusarium equiseti TaxID=61235 RepID=A0ABQ8RJC4_FUSEQ|nr:hypothetical protein NW768_004041 [Fusarium equiseti]